MSSPLTVVGTGVPWEPSRSPETGQVFCPLHEAMASARPADRIVVLAEGKVVEEGSPGQVLDRPRTERTRQFLAKVLG